MRTKVKVLSSEVVLDRLLEALGQELIDASDEEIIEAARSLGMDPKTRGSAAFAGLRYPSKPQFSDFFDLETCTKLRVVAERKPHQARRAALSTQRKDPPKR
jgi:hypothetical protein